MGSKQHKKQIQKNSPELGEEENSKQFFNSSTATNQFNLKNTTMKKRYLNQLAILVMCLGMLQACAPGDKTELLNPPTTVKYSKKHEKQPSWFASYLKPFGVGLTWLLALTSGYTHAYHVETPLALNATGPLTNFSATGPAFSPIKRLGDQPEFIAKLNKKLGLGDLEDLEESIRNLDKRLLAKRPSGNMILGRLTSDILTKIVTKNETEFQKLLDQELNPSEEDMGDLIVSTVASLASPSSLEKQQELILKKLLNVRSKDGHRGTLLHKAISMEKHFLGYRSETVKLLLKLGAAVNSEDAKGQTPLHRAAKLTELKKEETEEETREKIAEKEIIITMLIKAGAAVNKKDKKGQTPLFLAVKKGNIGAIKTLLENGATCDDLIDARGQNASNIAKKRGCRNYGCGKIYADRKDGRDLLKRRKRFNRMIKAVDQKCNPKPSKDS